MSVTDFLPSRSARVSVTSLLRLTLMLPVMSFLTRLNAEEPSTSAICLVSRVASNGYERRSPDQIVQ